ncbi:Predicted thiol-disulfide oxidoreductase YuxK, DCC family [Pustulibacterium marinum]|uniref:Predicted thiol-disulfide oxidoreductase YuxK, DCC family n=1 Tax=Pustulibacterium marinum TaxID=1224947 RepID=A0A1I7IHI7_9FLAO|nr:DCC1-like thiol-disulfide oxidoreductase family protein [Pustulibacterium marinum]SFU72398.1 Predicted thiol-disulfide oxidoreductase YuxK, DCC family [Pustulibacterium marinum]
MELPKGKHIVLFDGVCNLCDAAVQRIITHDKKDLYRFASLQSELGQQLLKERGIDTKEIDSIILIIPGEAYYIKADAALEIAKNMGSWYTALGFTKSVLSSSFTNWVYDFIAKNRYKWYGKKEACMIPTPELKAKFLDT